MPVKSIICDKCGIETGDFITGYDGETLCVTCDLQERIEEAETTYVATKERGETALKERLNLLMLDIASAHAALDDHLQKLEDDASYGKTTPDK